MIWKTVLAAACATSCAALAACSHATANGPSAERGKYLVEISGCNDCHTPKTMGPNGPALDTTKLLAGHLEQMKMPPAPELPAGTPWAVLTSPALTAWSGPWGISFAANLTPDKNTGLGNWTENMFVTAMRTGKHMGVSRAILPPMPWQQLAAMTDDDLASVYAYLRTIPPVTNHVPDPVPPPGGGASR
jgi:mono/diheme cytochrome c family protein